MRCTKTEKHRSPKWSGKSSRHPCHRNFASATKRGRPATVLGAPLRAHALREQTCAHGPAGRERAAGEDRAALTLMAPGVRNDKRVEEELGRFPSDSSSDSVCYDSLCHGCVLI